MPAHILPVFEHRIPHQLPAVVVVQHVAVPAELLVVVCPELDAAVLEPLHVGPVSDVVPSVILARALGGELLQIAVRPPLEVKSALPVHPDDLAGHLARIVLEPAPLPAVLAPVHVVALMNQSAAFLRVTALLAGEGLAGSRLVEKLVLLLLQLRPAAHGRLRLLLAGSGKQA